jgi:hypothetical protein
MVPYRASVGPTACSTCGTRIDPRTAFLTGDGPECDPCHRAAARKAKAVAQARATGTDAMLYGLLAIAGGLAMLVLAFLLPDGSSVGSVLKFVSLSAATAFGGCLQSFRLPLETGRARLGRAFGVAGAAAASLGLVVLLFRLL